MIRSIACLIIDFHAGSKVADAAFSYPPRKAGMPEGEQKTN
jgi:hypothetical protein